MPIAVVNPLVNFLGLFEGADLSTRDILEEIDAEVVTNWINDIPLDVIEDFSFTSEFEITDRPVEKGFPVTDSRRRLPNSISIVGVQVTGQEAGQIARSEGSPLGETGKSWKDKYSELMELKNKQELVTLTTSLDVYENLLIRSVNVARSSGERSDGLFFTIELKESTFAEAEISAIDPKMVPRAKRKKKTAKNEEGDDQGAGRDDQGNADAEVPDNRTFAKQILKSLAGGLI